MKKCTFFIFRTGAWSRTIGDADMRRAYHSVFNALLHITFFSESVWYCIVNCACNWKIITDWYCYWFKVMFLNVTILSETTQCYKIKFRLLKNSKFMLGDLLNNSYQKNLATLKVTSNEERVITSYFRIFVTSNGN